MDLNTILPKQTCSPTKKKSLILEARHSISIEASNKIRSKLKPRIFMPRSSEYRCTTKFDSKAKITKREILKNHEFRTIKKCQTRTVESFLKSLKGKYTRMVSSDKNSKIVEHKSRNVFTKFGSTRRCQNINILKRNFKKKPKDTKPSSPVVVNENLDKGRATRSQQTKENLSILQSILSDKESVISNCEKVKEITQNNSTAYPRYLSDGGSNFIEKLLEYNSSLDEGTIKHKERQMLPKHVEKGCKDPVKSSIHFKNKTKNVILRDNETKIKDTKKVRRSKKPNNQSLGKFISKKKVIKAKAELEKKNSTRKAKLSNLSEFSNKTNLQSNVGNSFYLMQQTSELRTINPNITAENYTRYQQLLELSEEKNNNLGNKETEYEPSPTATKLTEADKMHSTEMPKEKTFFDPQFLTATTAIADFQDAVRSSISFIYDCSPRDQKINEDLLSLDNSLENYSKYVLQIYKELDDQELNTQNNYERFRKKDLEQRKSQQAERSSNDCFKRPHVMDDASDTLTIIIEADSLPRKYITYKKSDILYPKIIISNDQTIKYSVLPLNDSNENHTTSKNKNKKHLKKVRRKITPKKANTLTVNTQNRRPSIVAENAKNTYNTQTEIYTQSETHKSSCSETSSLRFHRPAKHIKTVTSQTNTEHTVAIANCYNYLPTITNFNNNQPTTIGSIYQNEILQEQAPLIEESQPTYLHPPILNFYRDLSEVTHPNMHRFEYHRTLLPVPYLHNHYLQHSSEPNFDHYQMINYFGQTNLPPY